MREAVHNWVIKRVGGIFNPPPSLFDSSITGMLFIHAFKYEYQKQVFFVFYIIFLLLMTFLIRQRRDYRSPWLALFALVGMSGVFAHSFFIYPNSITFQYLNFYLLSEGFLYILFGIFFLIVAVRYSRNLKFLFLFLPIVFLPYLKNVFVLKSIEQSTRFTILGTSLILFSAYFLIKRNYWLTLLLSSVLFLTLFKYWHIIKLNFSCRPDLWKVLLLKIKEHPFIGHGFNHTLSPDNMTFHQYWGWLYNHNDYLAIASYLGIFATLFIAIFILVTIRKIGINLYLPLFLTLTIVPFFQMTMFDIDKATGFLLMTVLCITQTHFKEEVKC